MAAGSVALIHSHGVIHADISVRNFLVADDLSIRLCDISGSAIGNEEPFVEEDHYRMSPNSARSIKIDIFALGCPIFKITTDLLPYDEINDCEEVASRYTAVRFPNLAGITYRGVIYKCWTSHVQMLIN
jgi:serine/threonine protein kinase